MKPLWRLWDRKFWWTVPASEENGSGQVLKILKTEVLMNVSSVRRLEDSEDQVPKNPEDQKFCWTSSNFTGLKFWRSRQRLIDSDQASLKFKLIRSQRRKYKCSAKVHLTEQFVQGSHFQLCKSTVRRWVVNKSNSLSHNGSHNGYIIVLDYKRDSKERWR